LGKLYCSQNICKKRIESGIMRYYILTGIDFPDSLLQRQAAYSAHLARIQQLQYEGRLLTAGANPVIDSNEPSPAGFTGSLIIAKFHTQKEAEAWLAEDPYMAAGVYTQTDVKPFMIVCP
jgi:uncharacterized protein YciI